MRRMGQVRPVSVEVLDHIHGAVLELPAELGPDDVRLHRGVSRSSLATQLKACPELLLAETGFESHAVDVEDHGLLLFYCDGEAPAARGAIAFSCGSLARRGCPRGLRGQRSEEHTSELQSLRHLVCRLLLEKKKQAEERSLAETATTSYVRRISCRSSHAMTRPTKH